MHLHVHGKEKLFLALFLATFLALGSGCKGSEIDGDGDGDADSDADSDGDADSDADGDAPGQPGSSCRCDTDCAAVEGHAGACIGGVCFTVGSAECDGGSAAECAAGSRCWSNLCWPDVDSYPDCVGERDGDGSCAPTDMTNETCDPSCATHCLSTGGGDGSIGSACGGDDDCEGATCQPDSADGWIDGYCMAGCTGSGSACGDGGVCVSGLSDSDLCLAECGEGAPSCRPGYACVYLEEGGPTFCYPYCTDDSYCPAGYACDADAQACLPSGPCSPENPRGTCDSGQTCVDGGCEDDCSSSHPDGYCPAGMTCEDGVCRLGDGPGPGPGPTCSDLPPLECDGSTTFCGELIQFDPTNNPDDDDYDPMLGYIDYPENGESWSNQYRSWLRRDTIMMIQYAAAVVACKTVDWETGNGMPLGLIDMSEENGAIPGTSIGSPGHPGGTHVNGHDIDLAYFQTGSRDNQARPVCEHSTGGRDAYHCTAPPHLLDPWRNALFIAALAEHPRLRVIGMDGQVGPLVEAALATLCEDGWVEGSACRSTPLAYEVTDSGRGWYLFHHHHMHVSYQ